MAHPPSYQEAVGQDDWLDVVIPYISIRDYPALCLVCKRMYDRFAPRLWNDPLVTGRALGFGQMDDLDWYFSFLNHVQGVRRTTAELVKTLDFKQFAADTSGFYYDTSEKNISDTFPSYPALFPRLRCLVLDDHPEFEPGKLAIAQAPTDDRQSVGPLLVLSMPRCRSQLPIKFFDVPYTSGLVYLDVSGIPGSIKNFLVQDSFGPRLLPHLRILKLRGREVDNSTAVLLFHAFKTQLWSLDLGSNQLTDTTINHLVVNSFPFHSLQSDAHFLPEGKITFPLRAGSNFYGPFKFIEESQSSETFSHAERYLADAPLYSSAADLPTPEGTFVRSDGCKSVRGDTSDYVKRALAADWDHDRSTSSDVYLSDVCQGRGGITHLYLNGNRFTSWGIQRLLRLSPGYLEHFECDKMTLKFNTANFPQWLSSSTRLYGFIGGAHTIRPVISSNLRTLRVHHSLVTQTPTLDAEDMMTMASLWLAETYFRERIELAYPQSFVPDMNPRLYSLTLTHIPRHSTGHIIAKLIGFLRLAAAQERSIADATVSTHRRAPVMLQGLRHIRLEFEHDPSEEFSSLSDDDDLDPEELMSMAAKEFSFFGETGWGGTSPAGPRNTTSKDTNTPGEADTNAASPNLTTSGELKHSPFTDAQGDYVERTGIWNGEEFTVPVWIGSGVLGKHRAVNEYMKLLRFEELMTDIAPASPCQVIAGVPPGCYIFHAAWDAMLSPSGMRRPSKPDLVSMRDVLSDIKAYRMETKTAYTHARKAAGGRSVLFGEPHFYWTGRLEIAFNNSLDHYNSAKYWR